MWVGDPEKNIKAPSDLYRKLVKRLWQSPILLFNEADAIFGIRQQGLQRTVEKMEYIARHYAICPKAGPFLFISVR